jgi:hypothetical protein
MNVQIGDAFSVHAASSPLAPISSVTAPSIIEDDAAAGKPPRRGELAAYVALAIFRPTIPATTQYTHAIKHTHAIAPMTSYVFHAMFFMLCVSCCVRVTPCVS